MPRLNKDQLEDLKLLMLHSNWSLLMALIDQIIEHHVNRLLSYNLDEGPEGLVILKAQIEGMHKLRTDIVQQRDTLRK